ncbi:MAG: hypothetical protein H6828_14200 [Planctomycetes bacterium]|nr:hypothetical protein [Planctomycetota bacterium]
MNRERRTWLARACLVLGLAAIVWAVLHVTSAAFGDVPLERGFEHRRSYNQIKVATHGAFLGLVWRASLGGALLFVAARLREPSPE